MARATTRVCPAMIWACLNFVGGPGVASRPGVPSCHTLTAYESGANGQATPTLPSTYLGHADPKATSILSPLGWTG